MKTPKHKKSKKKVGTVPRHASTAVNSHQSVKNSALYYEQKYTINLHSVGVISANILDVRGRVQSKRIDAIKVGLRQLVCEIASRSIPLSKSCRKARKTKSSVCS